MFYKNEKVGTHPLDFIVDGKLVIELKSAAKDDHNSKCQKWGFAEAHSPQHLIDQSNSEYAQQEPADEALDD